MLCKTLSAIPRGGGGGREILYFHIYVGSVHFFWVQNFEFQYFLGFSENKFFLGVWRFCGYFLESSRNWTIFRGYFYAF